MARHDDIVVGLDIGTTKVCAIVGAATEGGLDVMGIGSHPSKGLRKGVVVNIDVTVSSIKKAVEEAEAMAGVEISTVYAGIAGSHIRSFTSNGVVAVRDGEVDRADVQRVVEAARTVAIPSDSIVLHTLPQEFIVDSQDGIREPVGMSGVRLEAKVHIVTGGTTSMQNITKCCERVGLHVADVVLQPLASSEAVLSDDEREIGVALVDIGGGTTDIVLFVDGSIVHTSVLTIGGQSVTMDVSQGLRTPIAEAEAIKQKHGCAMTSLIEEAETIEVPMVGGRAPRSIPRRVLGEIIEPRMEEIFGLVGKVLDESGHKESLAAGVVLTGGGVTMKGAQELAEEVLGMPVRRGVPSGIGGLADVVRSPMYATAVGLLKFGAKKAASGEERPREEPRWPGVRRKMGAWLKEIF
jgi:cell division protein FtsA